MPVLENLEVKRDHFPFFFSIAMHTPRANGREAVWDEVRLKDRASALYMHETHAGTPKLVQIQIQMWAAS